VVATEGPAALSKGLGATCARNSVWNSVYFGIMHVVNEHAAPRLKPTSGVGQVQPQPPREPAFSRPVGGEALLPSTGGEKALLETKRPSPGNRLARNPVWSSAYLCVRHVVREHAAPLATPHPTSNPPQP
jgi:hypothetical protein